MYYYSELRCSLSFSFWHKIFRSDILLLSSVTKMSEKLRKSRIFRIWRKHGISFWIPFLLYACLDWTTHFQCLFNGIVDASCLNILSGILCQSFLPDCLSLSSFVFVWKFFGNDRYKVCLIPQPVFEKTHCQINFINTINDHLNFQSCDKIA